jgi:hypothetical protein
MDFRLVYQGPLASRASPAQKHKIREALHPQLRELWDRPPLSDHRYYLSPKANPTIPSVVSTVGEFTFASLVHSQLHLLAELEIVILKPEGPGAVIRQGGDLDNQLKTLLDALRQPHAVEELPTPDATPGENEQPFFCLLEDDQLVSRVDLSASRWLGAPNRSHVHVDVLVRTKPTLVDTGNFFLA